MCYLSPSLDTQRLLLQLLKVIDFHGGFWMEAEVRVGENSHNAEASVLTDTGPDVTSMKLIEEPDPVVYKLVRVDGDGRLVPATDDEVMVVEDLLKDDEKEESLDAKIELQMEGTRSEGSLLAKTQLDFPSGQCCNPETNELSHIVHPGLSVDLGKTIAAEKESVNLVAPLSESCCQLGNVNGCSSSNGVACETGSSASAFGTSQMPDFSKVKGRICLDNLNVKELQETFRATFGRETSVKDKQWLKRRISMGLTNSCSCETTSFLIEDNKVIKISTDEVCKSSVALKDDVVEAVKATGWSPSGCLNPSLVNSHFEGRKSQPSVVFSSANEDSNVEQRAGKRARKPTKRYIEELSEEESKEPSGKLSSSMKSFDVMPPCSEARTKPIPNMRCDGKPVVTRPASLGGSGFQVPYVSRIRRCRPRENFMALMPSSVYMPSKMLSRDVGEPLPSADDDDEREEKVLNPTLSTGQIQQPLISALKKEKQYLESTTELDKHLGVKRTNEFENNSDVNTVTLSTPTGDMRRKQHRPWSLTEVVKLVDGVSKYGAGRWSEIKRFGFASYSYRTSVDLKDKWRNLLRASSSQLHTDKRMQNSRKPGSIPIPEYILIRVRELSQMQSQATANPSSKHIEEDSCRSLDESRSG